ncbi:MAG: trypsin-like peptidase domain-containing protein, partial [Gammaproteobacteria bacterium]|nr:trypsin-like peptidase domain-containing protein [Gammaproteobacteria bacterium]
MRGFVPLIAVATNACSAEAGDLPYGRVDSPVVYGHDSRVAPSALESQAAQAVLVNSTLAVVPVSFTTQSRSGSFTISAPMAAEVFDLCSSEPGGQLPAAAVCTGVAVAANVVATAAHCVADQEQCDRLLLVRGFLWDSWQSDVPADSVFRCQRVLFRRYHDCSAADLALIEIDRPLAAFAGLAELSPKPGERLIACGASFGAPIRCDPEATVTTTTSSGVSLAADVAIGASGGPVLDATGDLVGVLSVGAEDLVPLATCSVEATGSGHGIERAESADAIRAALALAGGSKEGSDPSGDWSVACTVSPKPQPQCSASAVGAAAGWWQPWIIAA